MLDRRRFFRGQRRESHFQRGDLKYVILDLIKDKPRYGYEIIRDLEERSRGFYTPSPGVIYPTLQMLEEIGYVTAAEQDGRKVYSLTQEGLQFLGERKDFRDEIGRHVRHRWNPENIAEMSEILGEFGKFRHLIGQRLQQMDPEKMRRIRQIISQAYEEIEVLLGEKQSKDTPQGTQ